MKTLAAMKQNEREPAKQRDRELLLEMDMPWDLDGLGKPPEYGWSEGREIRSLYYKSEPYKGVATRVFAYYATPGTLSGDPAKDKDLTAVVLAHGGGGCAYSKWVRLWASRGYAAIAMDLYGQGSERKIRLTDGGPGADQIFCAIDQPVTEQWTYHAVANVICAHSLIRSFPEVDARRTAITGISWGGYLTCIVAGIDNRFKAAVPVYGCEFIHENSIWLDEFEKRSAGNRAKWIQLWDPSRYVGSASMPMLFVSGGTDHVYPPDSHAKTYDLVRSQKNLAFVPSLPHRHYFDRPMSIKVFIEHHLKKGIPLVRISSLNVGKKRISASIGTKTKLLGAQLYYTLEAVVPGSSNFRK